MTREERVELQKKIIQENLPVPAELKDWIGDFNCGRSYNQPLPDGFSCESFICGVNFNQPLPNGFKCIRFFCGYSYNQPLPDKFSCKVFNCGYSFNQPLPDGFSCKIFQCGKKFNQPLPNGFSCEDFDCGDSFNQPPHKNRRNENMKIVLPLPPSDNRRFVIANAHNRRFVLSSEHRTYKNIVVPFAMLKYKQNFTMYEPTFENQLFISYQVFLHDKKRDGSNCEKVLKDSLKGILYDDDKWVNLLAMRVEIDKKNPRVELIVRGT